MNHLRHRTSATTRRREAAIRADYVLAKPPGNDSDWFRKDGGVNSNK